MDSDRTKALAVRLTALVDVLEERSERAVREVVQSSGQLRQTANGLGLEGQRLAREAVGTIGAQAQDALKAGLHQAVDQCKTELQQVARQAAQTAHSLQAQSEALHQLQQGLVWKCAIALMVGSVLAAGGSGYLAWKSRDEIKRAEFGTAIVRATQSGALTRCDDMLCVKAGKNAPRYGKNSEYVLLGE